LGQRERRRHCHFALSAMLFSRSACRRQKSRRGRAPSALALSHTRQLLFSLVR